MRYSVPTFSFLQVNNLNMFVYRHRKVAGRWHPQIELPFGCFCHSSCLFNRKGLQHMNRVHCTSQRKPACCQQLALEAQTTSWCTCLVWAESLLMPFVDILFGVRELRVASVFSQGNTWIATRDQCNLSVGTPIDWWLGPHDNKFASLAQDKFLGCTFYCST